MRFKIVKNRKFKWVESNISDCKISSVGIIWINEKPFQGDLANKELYKYFKLGNNFNLDSPPKICTKINNLKGHFSFMIFNNSFSCC